MRGLPRHILDYAESLPEATPLCQADLLHLGNRAASARGSFRHSEQYPWLYRRFKTRPLGGLGLYR